MKSKTFKKALISISLLALISCIFLTLNYGFYFSFNISSDHSRWAEFGDYIGGVLSPILAFLGLLALLFTIYLQNEALAISENELQLTRKELSETAKASTSQANHFETQAKIDDYESVIGHIEDELLNTKHWALRLALQDKVIKKSLDDFLRKNIEKDYLMSISPVWDLDANIHELNLQEKETRKLLHLLYLQIKKLKEIPESQERHNFYQTKYFWIFFSISSTGIINWDWRDMLDESYQSYSDSLAREVNVFRE